MDKKYLYILLIFVIALGLRLWGAGSFMTVDEENWMVRSAGFYHEMAAGNPGGTFLTTHPGATAMWLIGGGEVLQEKRVGMQVASDNLIYFRKAAVLPMVLATSFLIGLAVWLLDKKWGLTVSVTAGLLLAADPYLVGMSQIAHLDALQSLLMLDSLLAWLVYWQRKKYLYVAAAGILAGLALGTKMVLAFWLWPVFLLIAVAAMGKNISKSWLGVVAALGTVTGMAVLVLFIIWPALWVKADVSSSITRDISTVITDEHVALEAGSDPIAPITFYGRTWLGRVTPYNQILALGTLVAIFILWRKRRMTPDVLWLWFYALGYLLLVTYAAKKGDRYALPALVVMPALAGWTAAIAAQALGQRIKSPRVRAGMAAVAVMAVVAVPLLWSPYAIAYSNEFFPNIRPLSQQGWGEGLDEAAAWLNQHPLGDKLTVASWYDSVMRTYFHGKTFSLSSRDDYWVGYVVTYRNMGGRAPDTIASDVLDELHDREPVKVISIHGVPYVWIYETGNVGVYVKNVGEIYGEKEVGQTLKVEGNILDSVQVGFATYSNRNNTEDVILHVRRSPNSTVDIRTARINAGKLKDNKWQDFYFDPLETSSEEVFYFAVTSPTSSAGNAVTIRYADEDFVAGNMYVKSSERGDPIKKDGDLALRINQIGDQKNK